MDEYEYLQEAEDRSDQERSQEVASEENAERVWQVMLYIQAEMIHAWAREKEVGVVTTIMKPGDGSGFLKIEISKLNTSSAAAASAARRRGENDYWSDGRKLLKRAAPQGQSVDLNGGKMQTLTEKHMVGKRYIRRPEIGPTAATSGTSMVAASTAKYRGKHRIDETGVMLAKRTIQDDESLTSKRRKTQSQTQEALELPRERPNHLPKISGRISLLDTDKETPRPRVASGNETATWSRNAPKVNENIAPGQWDEVADMAASRGWH